MLSRQGRAAGLLQIPFEALDHRVPRLMDGVVARIEAHPAQTLRVTQQPARRFEEALVLAGHAEHAVVPVADVLAGGRLVEGHHAQP